MLQTSQLEGFNTVPPIRHLRVSGQVRHHPQTSPVLLPTHLPLPFPPPEASPPFPSPHFCGFSNLILVSPHTSGRKNSPLFSAVQTDSYLPNLTLTPPPHPVLSTYHPTGEWGEKKTQPKGCWERRRRSEPSPCPAACCQRGCCCSCCSPPCSHALQTAESLCGSAAATRLEQRARHRAGDTDAASSEPPALQRPSGLCPCG